MKNTNFIIFYNKIRWSIFIQILFMIIIFGISKLSQEINISKINFNMNNKIHSLFNIVSNYLIIAFIFIMLITTLLIIYLVLVRIFTDSLLNVFKAILGTFLIRRFMHQNSELKKINTEISIKLDNKVNNEFNRSVRHAVFDLSNNEILLRIKIPKSNQSQKILRDMEDDIKEHVSNLNPDYIISPFERDGYNLWLKGTKRS